MKFSKKTKFTALLLVCIVVCGFLSACGKLPFRPNTPDQTVTLSGFSAVFDNSHVIFEGDSLESVKPFVTVTARYSDGSTRVLAQSEFELDFADDGAFCEGKNTILVLYHGGGYELTVDVSAKEVPPLPKEHVLSLDCGGGSCDTLSVAVTEGEVIGTLPTPTRLGHTFEGWFVDDVLLQEDTVWVWQQDLTAVAHWSAKGTREAPLTVAEAFAMASALSDEYSDQPVFVQGRISGKISQPMDWSFELADDNGSRFLIINARLSYDDSAVRIPQADDVVVVFGHLYHGADIGLRSHGDNRCAVVELQRGASPQVKVSLTADSQRVEAGSFVALHVSTSPVGYEQDVYVAVVTGAACGHLEDMLFVAEREGEVLLRATLTAEGVTFTDDLLLTVIQPIQEQITVTLKADRTLIEYSDNTFVYVDVQPAEYADKLTFEIVDGKDVATLVGNAQTTRSVLPLGEGIVTVVARVEQFVSNAVAVQIVRYDPYTNVGASGFYDNYEPADSLADSYWRTKHGLLSGDISDQDQEPTIAANRPKQGNLFVRNIDENFADGGNTYNISDESGNTVDAIYKCGAYVTLEQVAAYIYAWGDVPANYTADKSGNPKNSQWGRFLRLNNSYFSGDTSRYPYEPVLPDINGAGGSLSYYETDIGTTGTDCDPSYAAEPYNNGSRITRGAARIVYARYDGNDVLLEPSKRYVFYTYNHYNDFQEYLNYRGGWGEMFGNITGGGSISSKYDCNPTPYVPTVNRSFGNL